MNARVLCVDDEPSILQAHRLFLGERFVVETAPDAETGLTILAELGPFAVVVSDLHTPGVDGIQFLAGARENHPDAIRILLTGYADLQQAIEVVNRGASSGRPLGRWDGYSGWFGN